jgi:hypothetical protein
LIAGAKLVDEIRGDLPVQYALDGQGEQFIFRRRSDRITTLRLVSVLGCKPDIDVLTGKMATPTSHAQ